MDARTNRAVPAPQRRDAARILALLNPEIEPLTEALRSGLAGRYDVERELGRGGMATVFLARDVRHGRAVALKVLSRDVLASGGNERFLREIQIAAQLTHPHVLALYDSGEVNGLLYYVMPYVDGETLRARLAREGALPIADVLRLARELADALAHAHRSGVVHRDLKPENVLISGGHAVIADFGIAKAIAAATRTDGGSSTGLTATGVSLGTPAYMAPEQAVGGSVDQRADLYSLGVIIYEALTGAHPFTGRTAQALVVAHLTESPAPLATKRRDVPPALAALVMQLLAKEPAARPADAGAVLRALDDASSSPATATTHARRFAWLAAAAAIIVAAFVVWQRSPSRVADAGPGPTVISTVAVLPFVNTGGSTSDEYFSDGLTDELAHALSQLPGLQLAGRTGSYAYKGKSVDAKEIGRALDVVALVEGTVRRSGDRIRVAAQLVNTKDGKVLLDSVFQSPSGDVFAVQDEFTRAIVAALAPALGRRPAASAVVGVGRGTTDQQAFELYLKGRYYWLARGADNLVRAIEFFKQAIARDPKFARAHAGLAFAYDNYVVFALDPQDTIPALIQASAERAMALDSTLADAQEALAVSLVKRLRFAEAIAHHRKASAIEPSNAFVHHAFGFFLNSIGRTDEAIAELQQATRLDPLVKSAVTALAMAYAFGGRIPESKAESRRVLAIDSTFGLALQMLALAYLKAGQGDSAVRALEGMRRVTPGAPTLTTVYRLFAFALAGRWSEAQQLRAELRQADPNSVDAAFAEMIFGDREPLVRLLMTADGQRHWQRNGFGCNPLLDPLATDERYRAAMRALGVTVCPLARPWPFKAPAWR